MNLKIFATGGSMDKAYSTQESDFVVGEPQIGRVLTDANVNLDYEIESLLAKDSLDITDEDRARIVDRVRDEACPRIVITHGTDTMIQTGLALIRAGLGSTRTIVLTGAMQPAAFQHTDADFNAGGAVIAAQILPPGVYIVMNGRVFDPQQAWKNIVSNRFEEPE
jgi:L-asparaginase